MAIIKYGPGADLIRNKHEGFTFQRNSNGESMFPSSRSSRWRYPRQSNKQINNQKAIRQWREMTVATKQNWLDFAAAFPQPTKKDPTKFLTGYQLFLKRNHYCFLNHGLRSNFMLEPELTISTEDQITLEIKSGTTSIDCSENYLRNFGIFPQVGDKLLLYAHVYGEFNGSFFLPVCGLYSVEEVFIDGLFVNVTVPDSFESVVVSVYLSKPKKISETYIGTKTRYMGCFTTKKFTELQDVPEIVPGDAGKVWTVNNDEDGMEFAEPGGGGLTCEDLPDCPSIISIVDNITEIASVIVPGLDNSIPSLKRGLLYNSYAFNDNLLLSSSDDWDVLEYTDMNALIAAAGGSSSGGLFKSTESAYWNSPNIGATDAYLFQARASGRLYAGGSFTDDKAAFYMWARKTSDLNDSYRYYLSVTSSSWFLYGNENYENGLSVRLANKNTLLGEGERGYYIGNNGIVYPTVVILGIEFMRINLAETLLRDGSPLTEIFDIPTFLAATYPAYCPYNFDWANV